MDHCHYFSTFNLKHFNIFVSAAYEENLFNRFETSCHKSLKINHRDNVTNKRGEGKPFSKVIIKEDNGREDK